MDLHDSEERYKSSETDFSCKAEVASFNSLIRTNAREKPLIG